MKIKPITTDAEHEEALAEIDRLMDRNPAGGTAADCARFFALEQEASQ